MTKLIVDSKTLSTELEQLKGANYVAIDTEFTRRRTFYPKLELVQLATDGVELCIDAAQCSDFPSLSYLFEDKTTTFIFHSASQDLDALILYSAIPRKIFDTQIAAELCGIEKVSYQDLVGNFAGVLLSKALKTSNWSKRPLSSAQIKYAMDDVRYLPILYDKLSQKLQYLNRLHWLNEECERQVRDIKHMHNCGIEEYWKSFDRGANLENANQHIARDLLTWREQSARAIDIPRQWLLRDGAIFSIASHPPKTIQQLSVKHNVGKGKWARWLQEILDIANQHRDSDLDQLWKQNEPLSRQKRNLVERILKAVSQVADQHQIAASLICSRSEAKSLVRDHRKVRLLFGWRYEITNSTLHPILKELD